MTEVVGRILDSHWQTPIVNATASEATNHVLAIVSPSIFCTTLPYLTLCKGPRAFANQLLMTAQAFDVASPKELHKAENNPRLRPSTTLNTPTCPGDLQALSGISHHPLSILFAVYSPLSFHTARGSTTWPSYHIGIWAMWYYPSLLTRGLVIRKVLSFISQSYRSGNWYVFQL